MRDYHLYYGKMKFKGGPLDGKTYAGGDGSVLALVPEERCVYVYRAAHPPFHGLRKRAAMCVDYCWQPLTKRQMRIVSEEATCIKVTK